MRAAVLRRAERKRRIEIAARRRAVGELLQLESARRVRPVERVLVERMREIDDVRVLEIDDRARRCGDSSRQCEKDDHFFHDGQNSSRSRLIVTASTSFIRLGRYVERSEEHTSELQSR